MAEENKETKETPEEKVGVYVCHCGGNISDHVNVKQVCENAKNIPGVVKVQDNVFMCSDPGQEMIMEDLKNGVVNRVVVASCAPDLHETTFRNAITRAGGNPYIYEHANIREQVSWVHHGDQATNKATRLVAAAAAKAKELKPLKPFRVDARKHVTVIGGGVAGMKAAIDLAARGMEVALIEKSPFLGGWTAKWDRVFPNDEEASHIVSELTDKVLNHPAITVYNCSLVGEFEGYIGNFKLRVRREAPGLGAWDSEIKKMSAAGIGLGGFIPSVGVCPAGIPEVGEDVAIETGVIVLATGFKPYTPRRGDYGYGDYAEVLTLRELIGLIAENRRNNPGSMLEVSGRKIRNLAMIHCVGSRQIPAVHEAEPWESESVLQPNMLQRDPARGQ